MPGPVRTQVSGHMEVSVSDCQYPRLAAWSGTERHPCIDLLRLVGSGCVPERVGDGGSEKGRHPYGWRGGPPDDRELLAGAFFAG